MVENSPDYSRLRILTANLTGYDKEIATSIIEDAQFPDIVTFQETWHYASSHTDFSIPGYTHYQKSAMNSAEKRKGRRHGGLLTYVKDCFYTSELLTNNKRLLPVQVGQVVFVNVYMPHNGHPDPTLYYNCISELETIRINSLALVVSGDLNPTGENVAPFNSFCASNCMQYDRSITYTFIEPRAFNRSRLDFCLIESSQSIHIRQSCILEYTAIKGGHLPVLTQLSVQSALLVSKNVETAEPQKFFRNVPATLPKEFYDEVSN